MWYLKALFFNFFVVFFANHILPGIDVASQTKLPYVGADLLFAVGLGFVNSLIYPILKILGRASIPRIAGFSWLISFFAYALLKVVPVGIFVTSFIGYLSASALVSIGAFVTNFLELKQSRISSRESLPQPPASEDCKTE